MSNIGPLDSHEHVKVGGAPMIFGWKVRISSAVMAVAGVLLVSEPAMAQSWLRMNVSASGSTSMWNRPDPAKESAVAAWSAAASKQAGAAYASWDIARGKKLECAPVSKSTVRCTATATPCRN